MKRLMAALLCMLLLLPSGGLAAQTGRTVRVTQSYDAAQVLRLLDGADADTTALVQGVCALVSAMECTVEVQDNGFHAVVSLSETELGDLTVTWQDSEVQAVSSLWPGAVLVLPLEDLNEAKAALTGLDLQEIMSALRDAAGRWAADLPAVTQRGRYVGETYSGGRERTRWTLDDRDLAVLADECIYALMDREDVNALCKALLDQDASAVGLSLLRATHDLAREDRGAYQVSAVKDEAGRLIGLSAGLSCDGEQAFTLSLGLKDTGVEALAAFTVSGEKLYLRGAVDRTDAAAPAWELELWQAKGRDYSEVADGETGALLKASGEVSITGDADQTQITHVSEGAMTLAGGDTLPIRTEETAALSSQEDTCTYTERIWYGDLSGEAVYSYQAAVEPSEPFALPDTSSLTRVLPQSGGEAFDAALQKGTDTLALRLFKALPTDVLAIVVEYLLP